MSESETYRGLDLNPTAKGKDGFSDKILSVLYNLFSYSLQEFRKPIVCRITIDEPKENIRFSQVIERWFNQRKPEGHKPLYLAVAEIRPRKKQRHIHLLVILDGCTWRDVLSLEERCQVLSATGKAKIDRRRKADLEVWRCRISREPVLDNEGKPIPIGSTSYHNLRFEIADAFKRNSYLAKNFTKTELIGNKCWSASRLPGQKTI